MRDRRIVVFDHFARNLDGGGPELGSTLMAIEQESSVSVDDRPDWGLFGSF